MIIDWGENDDYGNPDLQVYWRGRYLNSDSHYQVTYSQESGHTVAHFTGKKKFNGEKKYTVTNSYEIHFRDTESFNIIKSFPLKEGSMKASLVEYIYELPEQYHYLGKPSSLTASDFKKGFYAVRDKRTKIVTIKRNIGSLNWNHVDSEAKISIPYKFENSNDVVGTLVFTGHDVINSNLKDLINKKLLGYSYEGNLSLPNTTNPDWKIIGYEEGGQYYGLEYTCKQPITVKPKNSSDLEPKDKKVNVFLGNLKVEIPLTKIKESNKDSSTPSLTLTDQNLPNLLKEALNEVAKQVNIAIGSSSNLLPNYDFEFDQNKSYSQNLTSTDVQASNDIKIKVKPESHIRLHFMKASKETGEVLEEKMNQEENELSELSEVSLELGSEEASASEIIQVKDITGNGNLSEDAVRNYLSSKGMELNTDLFQNVDLSQPQDLEMINPDSGYIEIDLPIASSTGNGTTVISRPNKKPKPQKPTPSEEPMTPTTVSSKGKKKMFRLFNTVTGEHFYTSSEAEKNGLLAQGAWSDEGQGWVAPESSNYPVYRVFNPNSGEHHYTPSENEYKTLVSLGWNDEGIGWFSADDMDNKITLYRLYNPTAPEHAKHHYTVSAQERDHLLSTGEWNDEGVAWYGMPQE